jgi:hypothetical protein
MNQDFFKKGVKRQFFFSCEIQKPRNDLNYRVLSFFNCSPGNPEYSGELTTHGLIPSSRDCFNQLVLFKDIIN